jgi:hypothetical protein
VDDDLLDRLAEAEFSKPDVQIIAPSPALRSDRFATDNCILEKPKLTNHQPRSVNSALVSFLTRLGLRGRFVLLRVLRGASGESSSSESALAMPTTLRPTSSRTSKPNKIEATRSSLVTVSECLTAHGLSCYRLQTKAAASATPSPPVARQIRWR